MAPTGQPATLINLPLFHVTGEVPVLLQSFAMGQQARPDAQMGRGGSDAAHPARSGSAISWAYR